MAQIVLLPHYPPANANVGLNKITSLPDQWRPTLQNLQPRSFPTPFAIAESTAYHLERGNGTQSYYQDAFQALVRGFVLGHLRLELWNLPAEGGLLGSALSIIEPDARYLGVLVDAHNSNVIYGAVDRHALFWPGARVTQAQWQVLLERITGSPELGRAHELIADFREVLRTAKRWDAARVPWMRGLDELIGQNSPSSAQRTLHEDSQFFGPLKLVCGDPNGASGAIESTERIYLPALKIGYAKTIRQMCGLSFRSVAASGIVAAADPAGRDLFHITMPNTTPGPDLLFLGAGTVRQTDGIAVGGAPGKIDLQKPDGLMAAMNPILLSLGAADGALPTVAQMQSLPVFYPDVLRIAARLVRPSAVSYSQGVERLVQQGLSVPDIGSLGDAAAAVTFSSASGEKTQALYIERLGEHDVGDLRAIGYLLWLHFLGNAELIAGRLPMLASGHPAFRSDAELTEGVDDRPLSPSAVVGDSLADPRFVDSTRKHIRDRLATFQRYVRTYRHLQGPGEGVVFAKRAVEALVRWVVDEKTPDGRPAPFAPLGKAATSATPLALGPDLQVPLFVDVYREVS